MLVPPELISALASVGTFIVIATTAVAALIQLRHLQSSNQLQAMLAINERWDTPEMSIADHFVRTKLPERMKQTDYAESLFVNRRNRRLHPEMFLCDVWEQIGTMVKYSLIQKEPLLDIAGGAISDQWDSLGVPIALLRQRHGPSLYENFEYLAALSKRWVGEHPRGAYPSGMARLTLPLPTPSLRPPAPGTPPPESAS